MESTEPCRSLGCQLGCAIPNPSASRPLLSDVALISSRREETNSSIDSVRLVDRYLIDARQALSVVIVLSRLAAACFVEHAEKLTCSSHSLGTASDCLNGNRYWNDCASVKRSLPCHLGFSQPVSSLVSDAITTMSPIVRTASDTNVSGIFLDPRHKLWVGVLAKHR